MNAVLWSIAGGVLGILTGGVIGFGVALVWASAMPNPNDGTFAMTQMVVCLPAGALIGLAFGAAWGMRGRS